MDNQIFLDQLYKSLTSGGLSESEAARYRKRFESIISSADESKRESVIASLGSPQDVAANILKMKNSSSGIKEPAPEPIIDDISFSKARMNSAHPQNGNPGTKKDTDHNRPNSFLRHGRKTFGKAENNSAPISYEKIDNYKPPLSQKGITVFWWAAILTLPVTLAATAVVAGVFAAAYLGVVLIGAALIAGEVAFIVGGTALSVIDIIYGVVKMMPGNEVIYPGLYELGLGIIFGGATLIASILLYSLLKISVPFLMKNVTKFMLYTYRYIRKLVLRAREECGKL